MASCSSARYQRGTSAPGSKVDTGACQLWRMPVTSAPLIPCDVCPWQVFTQEALNELNARGDALRARLNEACAASGATLQWTGRGSMMMPHFVAGRVASAADARRANPDLKRRSVCFKSFSTAGGDEDPGCGCVTH